MKRIMSLVLVILAAAASTELAAATEVTNGLVASVNKGWVCVINADTLAALAANPDTLITPESVEQAFACFQDPTLSRQLQAGMRIKSITVEEGRLLNCYADGVHPRQQEVGLRLLAANFTEGRNLLEVRKATRGGLQESTTLLEIPLPGPLPYGDYPGGKGTEILTSVPWPLGDILLKGQGLTYVVRRPDHVTGVAVELFPVGTHR